RVVNFVIARLERNRSSFFTFRHASGLSLLSSNFCFKWRAHVPAKTAWMCCCLLRFHNASNFLGLRTCWKRSRAPRKKATMPDLLFPPEQAKRLTVAAYGAQAQNYLDESLEITKFPLRDSKTPSQVRLRCFTVSGF